MIYKKLVRDKIPEIIAKSGKTCSIEFLSNDEYLKMLDAKLDEEVNEYHQDNNLEELADILEVIRAITVARGYSLEELEKIRQQKATVKGTFDKKILLKEVSEAIAASHKSKQPKWDLQEAVALIHLYIEENGNVSEEKIHWFSKLCKKKAFLNGIQIDERYRNIDGIRMQLHCVEYVVTRGCTGLSNVSKIFYQAYDLYQSSPKVFIEIAEKFVKDYDIN